MQPLEVSGAVRPIYGSLGVKRLNVFKHHSCPNLIMHSVSLKQFLQKHFRFGCLCLALSYKTEMLLYLYRARNKITELSIPTHAQLQRHRLKVI